MFLTLHAPVLADVLRHGPRPPRPGVESFLYWSKERLGGRPTISVTHVAIVEPGGVLPEVIAAGQEIFATHYTTASLNITAIVRGTQPGEHYLVYLNRSRVDVFQRW